MSEHEPPTDDGPIGQIQAYFETVTWTVCQVTPKLFLIDRILLMITKNLIHSVLRNVSGDWQQELG